MSASFAVDPCAQCHSDGLDPADCVVHLVRSVNCSWEVVRRVSSPCAPNHVADVVGHQQRTLLIEHDAHGPAERIAIVIDEAVSTSKGSPHGLLAQKGTNTTL